MMLTHSKGLWRIEYRSDLTRAQGTVLPIGYVLESRWSNNVRWLGMLFRKRLTPIEVDHVDLKTWPEMAGLEPFMTRLFGEVWEQTLGIDGVPQLGAPMLAVNYSMRSSLQFVTDKADLKLSNEDPEKSFANLYMHLLGLHGALTPTLKAPVVQLPPPRKLTPAAAKAARPDVEQLSRAA